MNKKLGMKLQVHVTKLPTHTEYRVGAADYEGFSTHDIYDMIGAVGELPFDQTEWVFVNTEFGDERSDTDWRNIEVVPVPKLTYVEANACTRCGEANYLFTIEQISQELYDDMGDNKKRCLNCLRSLLHGQSGGDAKRGYSANQWRSMYRWLECNQGQIRESVQDKSKECAVCHGVTLPADHTTNYRALQIKDADDNLVQVHFACTFECGHCDERIARYSPWLYTRGAYRFHETYSVFGRDTCHDCYERINDEYTLFMCNACGSYQNEEYREQFYRSYVCATCYENRYECSDCGDDYISGSDHYCHTDSSSIHEYSYTPSRLNFHSANRTSDPDTKFQLFMGFELEIECEGDASRGQTAKRTTQWLGSDRVYCKSDGSLDNGIEIVTHPHTLLAYQQDFDWSALAKLSAIGSVSWNTDSCGLHVHVSRKTFGLVDYTTRIKNYSERMGHMVRFAKLIYDNQTMITQLAGRESENYASFSHKSNLISKFRDGSDNRFQAVNNCPNVTLEVRVFRGSQKKRGARATAHLKASRPPSACTPAPSRTEARPPSPTRSPRTQSNVHSPHATETRTQTHNRPPPTP